MDQSKVGINRLRSWVSDQGDDYLSEEDIVIAASVDEIPSPETLTRCDRTQNDNIYCPYKLTDSQFDCSD